jgi:hypothetical protein
MSVCKNNFNNIGLPLLNHLPQYVKVISILQKFKYTLKAFLLGKMLSSVMLRCVVLVRTDVVEEGSASIIRVTRIGELGTTLAVTSK